LNPKLIIYKNNTIENGQAGCFLYIGNSFTDTVSDLDTSQGSAIAHTAVFSSFRKLTNGQWSMTSSF